MSQTDRQNHLSFVAKLAHAWPPPEWAELHVVVAVSGGPDSVALLRGLHDLKSQANGPGRLHAAHFNHRWRGQESDDDARWVAALCEELGIPLSSGSAPRERVSATNSENAARQVRYEFLQSTAEQLGARYVCTAHTQNDQVETILHRIVRGTAMAGLAGIPRRRPLGCQAMLVRPLLDVRRDQLLEYLESVNQPYRSDSSNEDTSYTRNRIRNDLLPALREQFNPEVDDALIRLALQAEEIHNHLVQAAEKILEQTTTIDHAAATIHIACSQLEETPNLVAREVCKLAWRRMGWQEQAMGYAQWRVLGELVHSPSPGAVTLPGNVQAVRKADVLSLTQKRS